MSKPQARPYSQYSLDALRLLGQMIREARLKMRLTTTDLAVRAGVSRALLQRIEKGDPACTIGAVFEAAAICGVPLFELDEHLLTARLTRQSEKVALLPKSVRPAKTVVNDDF